MGGLCGLVSNWWQFKAVLKKEKLPLQLGPVRTKHDGVGIIGPLRIVLNNNRFP